MKTARLLLLMLLVLVLPLRGALAQALHCTGMPGPAATLQQQAAQLPAPDALAQAGAGHGHHGHHGSPAQGDAAGLADVCKLCGASCTATPLISALPRLAAPQPLAAAGYPALQAPPASHRCGGQDRPPRRG